MIAQELPRRSKLCFRCMWVELNTLRAVWLRQEKNVSRDNLEGKVGRMYVPRQEVETMPLRKMKVGSSQVLN